MALTHEVKHKQVIKVIKNPMFKFALNWKPTDLDMVTVWKSGEDLVLEDWEITDKFISFKDLIPKGSVITIREFQVVSRKKRKYK